MANSFNMPQLQDYLAHMNLKIAHIDQEHNMLELAFQGDHGQWHLLVSIQQRGNARKLLLIVPHIAVVTERKRQECLEALLAVNYRIALGKFGLDLEDGEVRLEECIPLGKHGIPFEQFQLAMGAIMQTVSMYYSLLPRIVYSDLTVQEALHSCEQDFFQDANQAKSTTNSPTLNEQHTSDVHSELDVNEVLAEVARIFGKF